MTGSIPRSSRPPAQHPGLRAVASFLIFIYLFLSGVLAFGTGTHLLQHGATAHHAKQHSSFLCTLMCATSSFVHSSEETLDGNFNSVPERPVVTFDIIPDRPATFTFKIRPPPDSFA